MTGSSNGNTHDNERSDVPGANVTPVEVEVEDAREEGEEKSIVREVPPPDWLFAWMWVSKQRAAGHLPN